MAQKVEIEIGTRGVGSAARRIGGVSKSIDRVGKRARVASSAMRSMYGAIGGVGIAAGTKRIFDFQHSVAGLAATAKLSNIEAKAMADQILKVGAAHNIAKEDVTGALKIFQDFGGILKDGTTILDALGRRATASSTNIKDLANVSASLVASGLTPDQSVMALDQLIAQADAGNTSMVALSRVISETAKVGATYGSRFKGVEGINQLGEVLQAAGSIFAENSERSKTAIAALFRDLTAKSNTLKKKLKIEVFDEKGMRNIQDIMGEIIKKTGGGAEALSKIFTADSQVIASAYTSSFSKESGKFIGTIKKVSGATGNAATIDEMYKRRMSGIASEAVRVEQAMKRMETMFIKAGGKLITWIDQNMGTAIATLAGGALGAKLLPAAIGRALSGGPGGGAGGLGGMGGAPIPVYIVGSPAGAGGFTAAGTAAGTAATKMGKIGSAASMVANNLGALAGSLGAGYAVGTALDNWLGISDNLSDWAFDLMNPGERDKRLVNKFNQRPEVKKNKAEFKKNLDSVSPEGLLKDRVKFFTDFGTTMSGKPLNEDLTEAGKKDGLTAAEVAKLLPALNSLVVELQAKDFLNISVTGPAGLDKPSAQINKGPAFVGKDK